MGSDLSKSGAVTEFYRKGKRALRNKLYALNYEPNHKIYLIINYLKNVCLDS